MDSCIFHYHIRQNKDFLLKLLYLGLNTSSQDDQLLKEDSTRWLLDKARTTMKK
jgi:hypothetical protein